MTATNALRGVKSIGLDTAPAIYFVEGLQAFFQRCLPFFSAIGNGQIEAITSVLTYTEALVLPLRQGDQRLSNLFHDLLGGTEGLRTCPVDTDIAEEAANLRARYNLRTPDAIQIATAMNAGCDAFLTNDGDLRRVADIRVIALSELTA